MVCRWKITTFGVEDGYRMKNARENNSEWNDCSSAGPLCTGGGEVEIVSHEAFQFMP